MFSITRVSKFLWSNPEIAHCRIPPQNASDDGLKEVLNHVDRNVLNLRQLRYFDKYYTHKDNFKNNLAESHLILKKIHEEKIQKVREEQSDILIQIQTQTHLFYSLKRPQCSTSHEDCWMLGMLQTAANASRIVRDKKPPYSEDDQMLLEINQRYCTAFEIDEYRKAIKSMQCAILEASPDKSQIDSKKLLELVRKLRDLHLD